MPNIVEITDLSAPELDVYARLTENQLLNRADPENAMFVAESPLVIGRALDECSAPDPASLEAIETLDHGTRLRVGLWIEKV